MLFFQALSHDRLPVEWIGFFSESLRTHLIPLLTPAPVDTTDSGRYTWQHLFSAAAGISCFLPPCMGHLQIALLSKAGANRQR